MLATAGSLMNIWTSRRGQTRGNRRDTASGPWPFGRLRLPTGIMRFTTAIRRSPTERTPRSMQRYRTWPFLGEGRQQYCRHNDVPETKSKDCTRKRSCLQIRSPLKLTVFISLGSAILFRLFPEHLLIRVSSRGRHVQNGFRRHVFR